MKTRVIASSLLLLVVVVLVYMANARTIGSGDTLPARYLPWGLLRRLSFQLDPFPTLYDDAAHRNFPLLDGTPYYLRWHEGHYFSAYTPGPALVALPVYALPVMIGVSAESSWAPNLEKLSAAVITAASVVLLWRALARLASPRWALAIALIYAFGTSSLSVSSQGLWQHGPSQLFVSLFLYWLVRGLNDERYLAYTGFAMTAAVAMRSTDLFLLLPAAAWIVVAHPRVIPRFLAWALVPAIGYGLYNFLIFGSALGAGGTGGGTAAPTWALFSQVPLREGVSGLLLSPARGLFVYSPVFVLSLLGCVSIWRHGPWAFRMLSLGLPLVVVVVGKWFLWWGGHSWGPRLLADTAPVLCFFLYPLAEPLSRRALLKAAFVVLVLFSVGAHAIGALFYDGRWDSLADVDLNYGRLWSWREGPLAFYAREGLSAARQIVSPAIGDQATSANSPSELGASILAEGIPAEVSVGEPITATLMVTNAGRALWLASAPGERGAVRVGWRWFRGTNEEPGGRALLLSDVPPRESTTVTTRIRAPLVPGDYVLLIDLVSEHIAWFGERGTKPIRIAVTVLPLRIERLVAAPAIRSGPVPAVSIAVDRGVAHAGDRVGLTVGLTYPYRAKKFDAYLLLRGPGGSFLFDGRGLSPADDTWKAWVKELPLPAYAVGRFVVPLSELPAGEYRWDAVLTEPGTYRPVVTATTEFRIEP